MKILLATDMFLPSLGGVERHVYTLSNFLAENGFDVSILTEKSNVDDAQYKNKSINVIRTMNIKKRDKDYKWPYTRISNSYQIVQELNKVGNNYDLIHYHGTHSLFMDYLKVDTPFVHTIHGIFPVCIANWGVDQWCGNNPSMIDCALCTVKIKRKYLPLLPGMMVFSLFYYKRMKSSLKSIDKVVSVSKYVGDIVKKGLELDNIINIYNFIDMNNDINYILEHSKKDNSILNVNSEDKIILFSGRLVEAKGIHILIDSFEEIHEKYDDAHLVITGGGKLQPYVEEVSLKYDNITYLGFLPRDEQLAVLKASTVFAAPSTYPDACPTSIIEAMSLGIPVVSTTLGGIPELILDGVTGHLVEPNDPKGLSLKILQVLSENREKYEKKCIEQAMKFDISRIGPQISTLYGSLS